MMTSPEHIELNERYGADNYHPLPVVVARAEGVWMWDVEGQKYLDFLAGYSALNQGHRHPRIMAALVEQAGRLTLTSRAFHNDQLGPFQKQLADMVGLPKVLPMNTGAEAVETAIKAARKWGYKVKGVAPDAAQIIVCADNFHGRTTTVVSCSTEAQYRDGFGPFTPGFTVIPFGDAKELERAITPETVAFLVEPIQGEGGINIPPDGYLAAVRAITEQNRTLLMLDEIQTGFARTGRNFCFEHAGITPDVITLGKALGGGVLPVSAMVATAEVMDVFNPGDHGSTFGGNPLACAVARASLDVITDEKLAERSAELGNYAMDHLRALNSPHVEEVRGLGLFIGVQIRESSGPAMAFCKRLMAEGILCKDTHSQVMRLAPPLVIEKTDLDWALDKIGQVLGQA